MDCEYSKYYRKGDFFYNELLDWTFDRFFRKVGVDSFKRNASAIPDILNAVDSKFGIRKVLEFDDILYSLTVSYDKLCEFMEGPEISEIGISHFMSNASQKALIDSFVEARGLAAVNIARDIAANNALSDLHISPDSADGKSLRSFMFSADGLLMKDVISLFDECIKENDKYFDVSNLRSVRDELVEMWDKPYKDEDYSIESERKHYDSRFKPKVSSSPFGNGIYFDVGKLGEDQALMLRDTYVSRLERSNDPQDQNKAKKIRPDYSEDVRRIKAATFYANIMSAVNGNGKSLKIK